VTTTNFPKSVEAPIIRFFQSPVSWDKWVKNGGMTAVVKLPDSQNEGNWNDVLVYEPDSPGESWWDLVPRNTVIRVSVREVARNGKDLIGFALPLRNQPSDLQALIAEKKEAELEPPTPEPKEPEITDADRLEILLKEGIEQKRRFLQAHEYKRLQRLILMGEWLEKNESALKAVQSIITTAVFRWYDDNEAEADTTALHEMLDGLHLYMDVIRDIRGKCWCPATDCDGTLYYTGHDGKPMKVLDFNELS
jgi:hypothetical protein